MSTPRDPRPCFDDDLNEIGVQVVFDILSLKVEIFVLAGFEHRFFWVQKSRILGDLDQPNNTSRGLPRC
jgi:hypothetical protein